MRYIIGEIVRVIDGDVETAEIIALDTDSVVVYVFATDELRRVAIERIWPDEDE